MERTLEENIDRLMALGARINIDTCPTYGKVKDPIGIMNIHGLKVGSFLGFPTDQCDESIKDSHTIVIVTGKFYHRRVLNEYEHRNEWRPPKYKVAEVSIGFVGGTVRGVVAEFVEWLERNIDPRGKIEANEPGVERYANFGVGRDPLMLHHKGYQSYEGDLK